MEDIHTGKVELRSTRFGKTEYGYTDMGNDVVQLEQVLYLDSQGIAGTNRDEDLESNYVAITLKLNIPVKLFKFPEITVEIPSDFTRDNLIESKVEEIEIPIKFEKDGELSTDVKIATKERSFLTLVMKRMSEMLDPDKKEL
tara:strand:- start:551 stop:976 length:426 start_codon:yes stop_codon:yes gene_type:complete